MISAPLRRIDRRSVVAQVRDELRGRIELGELATGDQLPGEIECADAFGVSRATVREAYTQLEQEGLVLVRRGHGRYVAPGAQRLLTGSVDLFRSMTDFLESQGYEVSTRLLSVNTRDATAEERRALELADGSQVVHLVRLRLGNGEPLAYTNSIFDAALLDGPAENVDWSGSVLAWLRARGRRPHSTTGEFQAVNLPEDVARSHGLDPCRAWLLVASTEHDDRGRGYLLSRDYIRGDVRTLHIVQRTGR